MQAKVDSVLLIDEGNTLVKWAIFSNESLEKNGVEKRISLSFLRKIKKEFPELTVLFVSSVRNNGISSLKLPKQWELITLNNNTKLPFINNYKSPLTLGADRKALVSAACNFFPKDNVLIISAGTCITYDFKDKKNVYYGGAISPGLQMRLDAMAHFTAKLPLLKVTQTMPLAGDNTASAMYKGALEGLAHEMNGFIETYRETYGASLKIMLAGGDALRLESYLKRKIFVEPQLGLYGLFSLYQLNNQK